MRHIKDNDKLVLKANEEYKLRKQEKIKKIERRKQRELKNKILIKTDHY